MTPGLRKFFYLTSAVTGAAILIVEILGAKMLSPFLGTSHFVWTAQITVALISLLVGYYLGGRLVDKSQNPARLYGCLLAAAVYLCLTIWLCPVVAYACLDFKLAFGSLLASLFLFFIPLTLMGMAWPYLLRILTSSLTAVGGQAGTLSAISTLGSVGGAALIGYVLVPLLPNSITMLITAGTLMAIALFYFLLWGRSARVVGRSAGAVVAGLGIAAFGISAEAHLLSTKFEERFRGNSNFGVLQVIERKGSFQRAYVNDYLWQNTYDTNTHQSMSLFTYMLHGLARGYAQEIKSVLCIGLGIGIVPSHFAREGVRVDVVEINPAVVPVAANFFDLDTNLFKLFIDDGRHFLNQTTNQYDGIILDAFVGDSSPGHLMSREAFASMRKALTPGGVLVINCFGDFETGKDYFTASLSKTLGAVFPSVKIHTANTGNVFFVASVQPQLVLKIPQDFQAVHPIIRSQVEAAYRGLALTHPDHGRVLTDDFNPVEFHDAANRERVRRNNAIGMKQ